MEPFDLANLGTVVPYQPKDALQVDDPKLQPFLSFETKEEYLAWRADWRERYADLSVSIRSARKTWRVEGNDHDAQNHNNLFYWRRLARTMLTLRAASKVKAEALYQQAKATAVA